MGYTTSFNGEFEVTPTLKAEDRLFLKALANTRRVKRDVVGYGVEGEFFVDGKGYMGQDDDGTVVDGNNPPSTQPGLWLQWVPNEAGTAIEWDGGEKFYEYTAWLVYIIKNILEPRGYVLNGIVGWQGEDSGDEGELTVNNNIVASTDEGEVYVPSSEFLENLVKENPELNKVIGEYRVMQVLDEAGG